MRGNKRKYWQYVYASIYFFCLIYIIFYFHFNCKWKCVNKIEKEISCDATKSKRYNRETWRASNMNRMTNRLTIKHILWPLWLALKHMLVNHIPSFLIPIRRRFKICPKLLKHFILTHMEQIYILKHRQRHRLSRIWRTIWKTLYSFQSFYNMWTKFSYDFDANIRFLQTIRENLHKFNNCSRLTKLLSRHIWIIQHKDFIWTRSDVKNNNNTQWG